MRIFSAAQYQTVHSCNSSAFTSQPAIMNAIRLWPFVQRIHTVGSIVDRKGISTHNKHAPLIPNVSFPEQIEEEIQVILSD